MREFINKECIKFIATHLAVKDLGNLPFFLGIQAVHESQGLHLNQSKYSFLFPNNHHSRVIKVPFRVQKQMNLERESIIERSKCEGGSGNKAKIKNIRVLV